MSVLRGVAPFAELWARRATLEDAGAMRVELLALPDLVLAKKTQRARDWPMLQRLVEARYLKHRAEPEPAHTEFWARELRTPEFLIEPASRQEPVVRRLAEARPLLKLALAADQQGLELALIEEERIERERDRAYWLPLKAELEQLRREAARRSGDGSTQRRSC